MKHTAVEWLVNQLKSQHDIDIERFAISDKAKAMEKEQIIDVYRNAYKEGQYSGDKVAEEYYIETYGK